MGRLEDIVERNRNPKANRERITVGIGLGLFLLLILGLLVLTDLGIPSDEKKPSAGSGVRGIPDVMLRSPGSNSR